VEVAAVITYLQAAVLGLLQGVTELFPVSSLGHSVLVPAFIGGSWAHLVTDQSKGGSNSPYLAFIVALHVATAIALLVFFRSDWVRVIGAFLRSIGPSLRAGRVVTADSDERLAWLIVVATVPVGLIGLVLEHPLRSLFAKPLAAAIFLTANGLILLAGERLRRAAVKPEPVYRIIDDDGHVHGPAETVPPARRSLATLGYREAFVIGGFQSLALLAGISRSGISMVGGLVRGLSHEDAARFSFLLATPVILVAGLYKVPSLAGSAGKHIHGQVLVGAVCAGVAAYVSVKFLTRYFETRTLTPFAVYSLVAGIACIVRFA
jgi:undecaprenyl-diphosphatase